MSFRCPTPHIVIYSFSGGLMCTVARPKVSIQAGITICVQKRATCSAESMYSSKPTWLIRSISSARRIRCKTNRGFRAGAFPEKGVDILAMMLA